MGNMKDEWFDEFYTDGEYPEFGFPKGGSEITFRTWNDATISDVIDGWDARDFGENPTDEKLNGPALTMLMGMYDIQDELADILLAKHEDYGPKNISNSPGGPLNGLTVRMFDKLSRLENLIKNNKNPKNESLRDTFVDLANYAIIGLLVIDGKWDKG